MKKKIIFDFMQNKFNLDGALDWIDANLLREVEVKDMSWIHYDCDDVENEYDSDKEYDEGEDYCPECAEKKVEELILSGEYEEGELKVYTDGDISDDGCARCDTCGVILYCSSMGTNVGQEIDHIKECGWDLSVLYNLVENREYLHDDENKDEIVSLLKDFFKSGKYKIFLKK